MKFELINPSDPYTVEAADFMVGAVAACLLGDGKYGLRGLDEDAEARMPVFLLTNPDEWFIDKFGMTYESAALHCIQTRTEELAQALESVTLTSDHRSSLNDIGRRAKAIAEAVRSTTRSPS